MRKLIHWTVGLGAAAVVLAAAWFLAARHVPGLRSPSGDPQQPTPRVLEKTPWDVYGYALRSGPRSRRYNVPIVIRTRKEAHPNLRILLDLQDPANYYFVEIRDKEARIGKVESGLGSIIGTHRPAPLLPDESNRLIIKRRYDAVEVVLNDTVVATAHDETFHGGKLGAGVLDDSATVKLGTPQPCDPVYFADDFMKGASEGSGWSTVSGSWNVATVRNPSLSSNAFYYVGSSGGANVPAAAVRGEWFWDNYRFRAAICSLGTHDVGTYFYYRDKDNYYLLRWNADGQPGNAGGRKQLVRRWHGRDTVLAEEPGGYQPRVWYLLAIEVTGHRIRTFIDGHPIHNVTDDKLCFGQVGLHSATPAQAHFDDVLVESVRGFEDDFSVAAAGRWQHLGGTWKQTRQADQSSCRLSCDGPAKTVTGSTRWRDYTVRTTVRLPDALAPVSDVGVIAHYLDEMNYALFSWCPASGQASLEVLAEGKSVASESAVLGKAPATTRHVLELECRGAVLLARLDGRLAATAWAPSLPSGRIGLHGANVVGAAFDEVRVDFPLPPEPVLTTHEVFSHELSMGVWAGAATDWEARYETLGGRQTRLHWHRASFPGDASIEVQLKDKAASAVDTPGSVRECRLALSAETGKSVLGGYNFVVAWPAAEGNPALTITRGDHTLAQGTLPKTTSVRRLRLERMATHLVASVNSQPVLAARDPNPLAGRGAAYGTVNIPVKHQDVAVFSENLKVYTFSRASSDWRPASGTWEISNRWQCDPRWSFFSGIPPSASPLAAIWNKYAVEGDVTVEFAVGPKMASERGGSYRYARDFNVTLCADGKDLNSGYGFIFGGWDDSRTAITRGNKVVAQSSFTIPRSSSIHRQWFYVMAEKRGATVSLWVDGSRVLTYTDPEPLPGKRLALWSWDCAIMVSRVRISATAFNGKEPPGTPSATCHTIYNPAK